MSEAEGLALLIENVSKDLGLEFTANIKNRMFVEFGSGSRLVTYKLYHYGELIKIQVNLVETLIFKPQRCKVRTLLKGINITDEEKAYFKEFLKDYCEFDVLAYDLREILCEKVRAILTRRAQKLRDFYDLYMLEKAGLRVKDYVEEIIRKLKPVLKYKRYREAFERNKRKLEIPLLNRYELSLFIRSPAREEFSNFIVQVSERLREIAGMV